jgi:exodeoxyribonuclease VII large subunit
LPKTWTVSELSGYVQRLLEDDPPLQDLWLTGEVSNFNRSANGHVYFTLKDAGANLSCVMWQNVARRLDWQPALGDAALAHGYVSIYSQRAAVQLYVDQLLRAGRGDLHARFEELREKLKAEGLFDREPKPLPTFPRVLGIVTSPQAAALRDVIQILQRRYPLVQVLLAPTQVQGEQAPPQIVAALQALDVRDDVEVILLVRGGGSLEELWAFNDERVARAVAACRHPVVCGVGHETDFTISDFVADLRAPTPSAAAELATPDQAEVRQRLKGWQDQIQRSLKQHTAEAGQALARQERNLARVSPQARIDAGRQQADELVARAGRSLSHTLALWQAGLSGLEARLEALSPLATLERGYAVVQRGDSGMVVASVDQVTPGDVLTIRVRDGEFGAVAGQAAQNRKSTKSG